MQLEDNIEEGIELEKRKLLEILIHLILIRRKLIEEDFHSPMKNVQSNIRINLLHL